MSRFWKSRITPDLRQLPAYIALVGMCGVALAAVTEPSGTGLPFKPDSGALTSVGVGRVVIGFAVAALIGVVLVRLIRKWLPRSLGQAAPSGARVKVLEARRISPRLSIILIQVDSQRVLLSHGADGTQVLLLDAPVSGPMRETDAS